MDSRATTALVVAGGRSRRMGQDKRLLRLWGDDGPTLLEHTVGLVAALVDEVVVVLNDPAGWAHLPARLVADAYGDAGALGGLATGLAAARTPYVLAVAGDMPLLNPMLLQAMLALPRDYDVLVAQVAEEERGGQEGGRPGEGRRRNILSVEPLHAIYSHACLAPMEARLRDGRYQIVGFFDDVRVRYLDPALLAAHDPHGHSFLSVNTPEQLARAQALLDAATP